MHPLPSPAQRSALEVLAANNVETIIQKDDGAAHFWSVPPSAAWAARTRTIRVVPIHFAYENTYLYGFSTFGQKVKWMRANPEVCLQTDEVQNQDEWISVIVYGECEELPAPQYTAERKHASSLLARRYHWWLNALGERQMRVGENLIEPLFFRIRIQSMSGLRATDKKAQRE